MSDRPRDAWIDELERDLGPAAVLRLLANVGGQRRNVPKVAEKSRLAAEVGVETVAWLSARFGDTEVDFPSARSRTVNDRANALRAAVLDAGLTDPSRSANDLAKEFGVTAVWVRKLRADLRHDLGIEGPQPQLPLFD